jgi:hypothetical protein
MNIINLLIAVLVILVILHFLGGFAVPTYRETSFYVPGGVGLLIIVLIVIVLTRL